MRHLQEQVLKLLGSSSEMSFDELLAKLSEADVEDSELWAALAPLLENGRVESPSEASFRLAESSLVSA